MIRKGRVWGEEREIPEIGPVAKGVGQRIIKPPSVGFWVLLERSLAYTLKKKIRVKFTLHEYISDLCLPYGSFTLKTVLFWSSKQHVF